MNIDIYYQGNRMYSNVTHEEAADILHELALERYEEKNDIDLDQLEIIQRVEDSEYCLLYTSPSPRDQA